ncbi:sigma-70 family RNA polymerase sigma factor [Candidatus Poribacteria bacterium]|nr:sigma-70 family RNA polymerase sigma factor [Candidatus Poribacteria bacterium]
MEELNLLLRAQAGDLDAYGTIVQRFQDMAVGYAYSILRDFQLAEDAAQEAFIEAYANLSKVYGPAAFPGWLRKMIFKHCDRLTRGTRAETLPPEALGEIPADMKDPAEVMVEQEMKELVLAAIAALPEKQREATTLFYINGYSQKEIADFLEVPVTTVDNRLRASRKRLKATLSPNLIEERMITMVKDNLQEQRPSKDEKFAKEVVNRVERAKGDVNILSWGEDSLGYYEREVRELMNGHRAGLASTVRRLKEHLPRFAHASDEAIRASNLSTKEAQLALAHEKGFPTWDTLIERARLLGSVGKNSENLDARARAAFDAVGSGDVNTLKRLLAEDATLIHATLDNATLLEKAAWRQPEVNSDMALEMAKTLIHAGSLITDLTLYRACYGDPGILEALIDAGALKSETNGLLALKFVVMEGNGKKADVFVKHGVKPQGFWMAAGVGDLEGVKGYFDANGQLKPEAAAYRPNLADMGWFEQKSRSDDPQEILEEAFVIACANGRIEVAKFLFEKGVPVDAIPPGLGGLCTPLHFAVRFGHLEVVKFLVEHGAEVNRQGAYHETPLKWAAKGVRGSVAAYLCEHGAQGEEFLWFFEGTTMLVMREEKTNAMFLCDGKALFRLPEHPDTLFHPFLEKHLSEGMDPLSSVWVIRKGTGAIKELTDILPGQEELEPARLVTSDGAPALHPHSHDTTACAFQSETGTYQIQYPYYRLLQRVAGGTPLTYYIGWEDRLVAYDAQGRLWGLIMRLFDHPKS